jgi:hypothetical protein
MARSNRQQLPEELKPIDRYVTYVQKFFTWYGGFCFVVFIFLPLFEGFDGLIRFLYWSGFFVMILFTIFEFFVDVHSVKFLRFISRLGHSK